jgi:7-cyano-7-deazaguanine reductase
MSGVEDLREKYAALEIELTVKNEGAINTDFLFTFDYENPEQPAEVAIDTDEFTAVCPWTGLPDQGTLQISYIPKNKCVELKSLKYYLLSFRDVGILQEHAANRILRDLVTLCEPRHMKVVLDYNVRGGLHTVVTVEHKGSESDQPE